MPSKEYFRNLARMSRRVASNTFDRKLAARIEEIGKEFDHQADQAPNFDLPDEITPRYARR